MKLERLISIIYMLLNHGVLSASALAEKFNVSQRTIYRDIDTICAAGVPVVSYQGVKGGYGIIEEYKLDKSLLGSYDVQSLITILHSMSTVFEDERALETIHKLQTIQSSDHTPSLSVDIGSRPAFWEPLRVLRAAITECRVVRFGYINAKSEKTVRIVEPVRLLYQYDTWYLCGYCRARRDYRRFRLSRMIDLSATQEYFRKHEDVPQEAQTVNRQKRSSSVNAVIRFSADSLARAMDFFYNAEKKFHDDGSLTVTVPIDNYPNVDWLTPVLLSFGDDAELVGPPELRKVFKSKLKKILQRY